ncbi:hypothetical protein [Solimonas terrae]|uniref:DUF2306 domain-containing protein n=1 Tax=Solimonas terrae TaxID=1396819 RepID=A0A6M2BWD0_9GAMM|nr:hypothetical protein [Solimonas terrae]NGY06511.1 hypothetical protein [Solimonas terrae]
MYSILLGLHAVAGSAGLASFWTAGLARKGSRLHALAGRSFLIAMCAIGVTALPMALIQLARGHTGVAIFLLYLLLITASSCITAWFAIRMKRDYLRYRGTWYRLLAALNLACGLALLGYGLASQQMLLAGFSSVGIVRGMTMWRLVRRPEAPRWWLREHFGSMLGNGVATHIAFLSIGLNRLLPVALAGTAHGLAWFGPLAIALAVGIRLNRRYGVRGAEPAWSRTTTSG